MSNNSIKDVLGWSIGLIILFFCVAMGVLVTAALTQPSSFAKGYCTALGGVPVSNENCNVDGKVVPVQSWR